MKKTILIIIGVIIIIIGVYLIATTSKTSVMPISPTPSMSAEPTPVASTTPVVNSEQTVIGTSVQGNPITAYHYGTGAKEILLVGGIHGGYEWNTVLVAEQMRQYLKANPGIISSNVKVTVIPVLNPDGLNKVVGTTTGNFSAANVSTSQTTVVAGRFNANNVDLNRNFDCDWQPKGTWQSTPVSGGASAFSEPESQAIKSYVESAKPVAVLVWYSAAGGVFASNCHSGVSTETSAITKAIAQASGYNANESFDFYATTGDMTNWLAKIGTPAISIILTNHTDTEWSKNLLAVKALLQYYAN
ncbi:MAG: M14 family metallopeptidase [Patescibacteria group bacterium]